MSMHLNGQNIKEAYLNGKKIKEGYLNGEKVISSSGGVLWEGDYTFAGTYPGFELPQTYPAGTIIEWQTNSQNKYERAYMGAEAEATGYGEGTSVIASKSFKYLLYTSFYGMSATTDHIRIIKGE